VAGSRHPARRAITVFQQRPYFPGRKLRCVETVYPKNFIAYIQPGTSRGRILPDPGYYCFSLILNQYHPMRNWVIAHGLTIWYQNHFLRRIVKDDVICL
jgi:hypothetical protein